MFMYTYIYIIHIYIRPFNEYFAWKEVFSQIACLIYCLP